MSKFVKALEQAERDAAARREAERARTAVPVAAPPAPPPTTPVITPPRVAPPPPPVPPPAPAPAPVAPPVVIPAPVQITLPAPAASPAPAAPAPAPARRTRPARRDEASPETAGVDPHLVSLLAPSGFEAEQYRGLRHLVEQLHKAAQLAVIAVTSPAVADGKTTTAINLAGALAQSQDARVLLVDADFRWPSVAGHLGLENPHHGGLVEALLDGSLGLDAVVRRRPPFRLDLLPAGEPPAAPYELLRSPRLGELLEAARRAYDFVVEDTPPLVALPDARVLSRWVDGILLVVAAHKTPRRLVGEALSLLDPDKVVGLVFNGDDRPLSASSYRYGYVAYSAPAPDATNGHRPGWWARALGGLTPGGRRGSARQARERERKRWR